MTCDSWIPVIGPHLSEILVDPTAWARIRTVARALPADCLAVLEIRLAASGGSVVDLSVRLTEPAQARHVAPRISLPHVRELLCRWSCRDECLSAVSSVWLEFDLGREPSNKELPVPVLCSRLRSPFDSRWLIDSLMPAMRGRPLGASQRDGLRRSIEELPRGGRVLYAFSLLSRPGDAVRLELFGLGPKAMADYLRRWVSSEAARQVDDLAGLIGDCDRYHLSFDVGREIAPRIGVEVGFERLPHREPRWGELFDRLVERGLCTSEERGAVFAWPGYDTRSTASDRWPEAATAAYCVRCLSHVKLVTWPDRDPEAKVYLIFQPLGPTRRSGSV